MSFKKDDVTNKAKVLASTNTFADYLNKSGLSLWVKEKSNTTQELKVYDIVDDFPDVYTAHNCGCNGGSCNASC